MAFDFVYLIIGSLALLVAVGAAWFAWQMFVMKSGLDLRGSYSVHSSVSCDDKYVGSVTIQNLKDRAVVIFKIFLKVGHNYYIELEDFSDHPVTLEPFAVLHRDYEPIEHYSVGIRRVKIDKLLDAKGVQRRLVLATSEGRYIIRDFIRRWDPVTILLFRNHYTGIIQPIRSTYRGKAYGSNAKYVVLLKLSDGKEEVIAIYADDYRSRRFRKFDLPYDALQSANALEEFLLERAIAGDLQCTDLSVVDMESWRKEEFKDTETFEAPEVGWFMYYVVGRVLTWWDDLKLKRRNRKVKRTHLADQRQAKKAARRGLEPGQVRRGGWPT